MKGLIWKLIIGNETGIQQSDLNVVRLVNAGITRDKMAGELMWVESFKTEVQLSHRAAQ